VSEKHEELHPDLLTEIAESKLPIHFYADIAAFVTSQSLSHQEVDAAWAEKCLQTEDFEHRIVMEMYKAHTKYGVPELVAIENKTFAEGIAYKIAPDSDYAELKYEGKARLTFNILKNPGTVFISHSLVDKAVVERFLAGVEGTPYSVVIGDMNAPSGDPDGVTYLPTERERFKVEKSFNFEALLSVRIEKEKLVSWQVDDIQLVETDADKRMPLGRSPTSPPRP
jgi:hypothetical protein